MSHTLHDLGIDRLSIEDRLLLIGEIWDSISVENHPIPQSHCDEIDRRLADADAKPAAGIPWEEVRARLREEK
jgi:putative addiction module component (TIGR02574 family)